MILLAKYPGTCPCGRRIAAGDQVDYRPAQRRVYCTKCLGANIKTQTARLTRAQTLGAIDAILSNDETSTDDELRAHFVREFALTPTQAAAHVARRNELLRSMTA